jgi:hypothetical protein
VEANDVIRWKRPGKIEDHRAWMVDRAASGMGFLAQAAVAPRVGDLLNIRRQDEDRWEVLDRTVRVARTTPTSNDEFVMVGCTVE